MIVPEDLLSYEELLRQDWFLKEQENSGVLFFDTVA